MEDSIFFNDSFSEIQSHVNPHPPEYNRVCGRSVGFVTNEQPEQVLRLQVLDVVRHPGRGTVEVAPRNACHASVVRHEDVDNDDDAKTTRRDTLVDDSAGDRIDRVASASSAVVVVEAARVSGNFSRAFQR